MENKKEYSIYIRNGQGTPYILDIYNNLDSAKLKLYDMIQLEETRERPYYVDNDFFDNKYNIAVRLKYFYTDSDYDVFSFCLVYYWFNRVLNMVTFVAKLVGVGSSK